MVDITNIKGSVNYKILIGKVYVKLEDIKIPEELFNRINCCIIRFKEEDTENEYDLISLKMVYMILEATLDSPDPLDKEYHEWANDTQKLLGELADELLGIEAEMDGMLEYGI